MSKRALVTGGSGGIGQTVCQALGEAGFDVIVHGCTRMDRAEAVAQAIRDRAATLRPCASMSRMRCKPARPWIACNQPALFKSS